MRSKLKKSWLIFSTSESIFHQSHQLPHPVAAGPCAISGAAGAAGAAAVRLVRRGRRWPAETAACHIGGCSARAVAAAVLGSGAGAEQQQRDDDGGGRHHGRHLPVNCWKY